MTVRNRLEITKKAIEALERHSSIKYQLYVYNNQTNYKIKEHFDYFMKLYSEGKITQITFNTNESTFNAFSKASACNMFGLQHNQDPKRNNYDFLLMIDNDIIVVPEWDLKLKRAWKFVTKNNLNYIKVIGQLPGGIKNRTEKYKFGEIVTRVGKLGGSGLWSVRPNFFDDVGILPLKQLVGQDKKHDQLYWGLMNRASKGKPYIMGLKTKLGIHCGRMAGSVCNRLTRHRGDPNKDKIIYFEKQENNLGRLSFDDFYKKIIEDRKLVMDW
jgi:hypothetical protein